jgi:hypothetical protein
LPAKVYMCAVVGLDGQLVEVEVDIAPGLPRFKMVGSQDTNTAACPSPYRDMSLPSETEMLNGYEVL